MDGFKLTDDQIRTAQNIMVNRTLDDDTKLLLVFDQYKDSLGKTQLFYALLAWADTHRHELLKNSTTVTEQVTDKIQYLGENKK